MSTNFEQAVAIVKRAAREDSETPEDFVARVVAQAKAEMTDETMRATFSSPEKVS